MFLSCFCADFSEGFPLRLKAQRSPELQEPRAPKAAGSKEIPKHYHFVSLSFCITGAIGVSPLITLIIVLGIVPYIIRFKEFFLQLLKHKQRGGPPRSCSPCANTHRYVRFIAIKGGYIGDSYRDY